MMSSGWIGFMGDVGLELDGRPGGINTRSRWIHCINVRRQQVGRLGFSELQMMQVADLVDIRATCLSLTPRIKRKKLRLSFSCVNLPLIFLGLPPCDLSSVRK